MADADTTLAQLRRSEELTRRLIEAMPAGVVHVSAEGAIQRANQEALRILGLSFDALTSKYTQEFETETIFEDESPCAVEDYPVTKAIVTGEAQDPVTIGVRRPDGGVSWAVFTAVPVTEGDTVTGAVVTFLDITERRRMERTLRQSQKMEAIGRLAGGVAHDFNNLLTVILGNAQVVAASLDEGDARTRDLQDIQQAARHAESLTAQMLEFARRQPVRPRLVELEPLVDHTVSMVRRVIGEQIRLHIAHASRGTVVELDPPRFEQVLINLCVNARDAMPNGGNVRISTRTSDDGAFSILEVSDEGHGIAPEHRDRVFEPFFTTKPIGQGTGLGLATVYGAVTQAGGTIELRSDGTPGTTFEIRLPARVGTLREVTRHPSTDARGGTETVLVAEDEPLVRDMVARALTAVGYTVLEAEDGEVALRLAEAQTVDVVITDVVMSALGGRELVARLRADRPQLPVVFISGYPGSSDELDGEQTCYVPKPFSPASLLRQVRRLLDAAAD